MRDIYSAYIDASLDKIHKSSAMDINIMFTLRRSGGGVIFFRLIVSPKVVADVVNMTNKTCIFLSVCTTMSSLSAYNNSGTSAWKVCQNGIRTS